MPEETLQQEIVEASIYGLKRRERVKGLIDSLATIPCVPRAVYRADKCGRLLAVEDALRKDRLVYVRVLQWEPRVVIEWTTRPQSFHPQLKRLATQAVTYFTTTLRIAPLRQKFDLVRHAALTVEACKNG